MESSSQRVNDACFSTCGCNSSLFQPVCGDDGLSYFSPCTAGCHLQQNNGSMVSCNELIYICLAVCASEQGKVSALVFACMYSMCVYHNLKNKQRQYR